MRDFEKFCEKFKIDLNKISETEAKILNDLFDSYCSNCDNDIDNNFTDVDGCYRLWLLVMQRIASYSEADIEHIYGPFVSSLAYKLVCLKNCCAFQLKIPYRKEWRKKNGSWCWDIDKFKKNPKVVYYDLVKDYIGKEYNLDAQELPDEVLQEIFKVCDAALSIVKESINFKLLRVIPELIIKNNYEDINAKDNKF